MEVEKIYEQTRAEIDKIKTEQAVRLEKVKTLSSELGLEVDVNLKANAIRERDSKLAEKTELESKIEKVVKELEDGQNS